MIGNHVAVDESSWPAILSPVAKSPWHQLWPCWGGWRDQWCIQTLLQDCEEPHVGQLVFKEWPHDFNVLRSKKTIRSHEKLLTLYDDLCSSYLCFFKIHGPANNTGKLWLCKPVEQEVWETCLKIHC